MITPLFGGGYDAGKVDPDMPIRPSSIRGHLRFWWRATRGAKFDTVEELRQREGEIWGSMENPSPVVIEVVIDKCSEPVQCVTYEWDPARRDGEGGYETFWSPPLNNRHSPLPYVLFPFQGKAPEEPPAGGEDASGGEKMISSLRFELNVTIPDKSRMACYKDTYNGQRGKKRLRPLTEEEDDIEKDVEAAVWAWVNFGGIGARTRRGCGALFCLKSDPPDQCITPENFENFNSWFKRYRSHYELSTIPVPREWPTLGRIFLKRGNGGSIACWEDCINSLKSFRQGNDIGRDKVRGRRPGRSRWPEPESLRNLIEHQRSFTTKPPGWHDVDPRIPGISFPRAEFGMPIIFEIRKEGIKPTLQPKWNQERMASPLILRPIKFHDGNTTSCASMIIRMNTKPLTAAYLKPRREPPAYDLEDPITIFNPHITDPDRNIYPVSPMKGRCTTGSALDAFINFAQEKINGFTEVP